MKRKVSLILACLLVAVMALCLCACGESGNGGGEKETTAPVETKAPEKETTAPAETVAPETQAATPTDGKSSANPLVSDSSHIVIDQDGIFLSYEYSGNDIIGCICYVEVGSADLAAGAADVINSGEDTTDYGYTVLGAISYEGYVGVIFGSDAWEGIDVASLQAAIDEGTLTKAE